MYVRFHTNFALINVWTASNFKGLQNRKWRWFLHLTAVKAVTNKPILDNLLWPYALTIIACELPFYIIASMNVPFPKPCSEIGKNARTCQKIKLLIKFPNSVGISSFLIVSLHTGHVVTDYSLKSRGTTSEGGFRRYPASGSISLVKFYFDRNLSTHSARLWQFFAQKRCTIKTIELFCCRPYVW